jgi:hypothetical protein
LNPFLFQIAHYVVPPIASLICAPAGYAGIARIESDNKISTIETVEFTHLFLGKDATVPELIAKIKSIEPFRALWLAEGLGQVLGNRAMARDENSRDLLSTGEGALVPENMQLMVHAGLCLALARHTYDKLGSNPTADDIRRAAVRIAELARQNLLPGYAGIGYEAWGMVTQFFYRPLLSTVIKAVEEVDPARAPFLWHGAGRACYFIDFMPRWNEPWPAFPLIDRMVVSGLSRHNLLAGLAAGMAIVNMKTPAILEAIATERIASLSSGDRAAFGQGVACALIMRQETSPDEQHTLKFVQHVPAPEAGQIWEEAVGGPARLAFHTLHPKLKSERRLDEVCCYRPLSQLLDG